MPERKAAARRSRRTFLKQAGLAAASAAFPSIQNGTPPMLLGEEGLADIRVVRAIMESSRNDGARVEL